jgi:hypothetical protein
METTRKALDELMQIYEGQRRRLQAGCAVLANRRGRIVVTAAARAGFEETCATKPLPPTVPLSQPEVPRHLWIRC